VNGCSLDDCITWIAAEMGHLNCLLYCLDNNFPIHTDTLIALNRFNNGLIKLNLNLLENIKLRSILFHKRLQGTTYYLYQLQNFTSAKEEYINYINKIQNVLELKTNLPTDVIKYNILKII
jgi:hypothetical protein